MHLIEIFLPITNAEASRQEIASLTRQLTDRFGGVTAFTRAPGEGLWENDGVRERDNVVVVEVMIEEIDRAWWRDLRLSLQERLDQKEIVIRTHRIDKL